MLMIIIIIGLCSKMRFKEKGNSFQWHSNDVDSIDSFVLATVCSVNDFCDLTAVLFDKNHDKLRPRTGTRPTLNRTSKFKSIGTDLILLWFLSTPE